MKISHLILLVLTPFFCNSQTINFSDGSYAMPENVVKRPESFLGFPNQLENINLLESFKTPPHGYGEIPFYWWTGGDTLTKERLLWQLDQLSEAGVLGLNISYNHTSKIVDTLINKGKNVIFKFFHRLHTKSIEHEQTNIEENVFALLEEPDSPFRAENSMKDKITFGSTLRDVHFD